MKATMAIDGDLFTLMQTEVMEKLRREFDETRSWVAQNEIIERAKTLQLPYSFIQELRNDKD